MWGPFSVIYFSISKCVDDARHVCTLGLSLRSADMLVHMKKICVKNFRGRKIPFIYPSKFSTGSPVTRNRLTTGKHTDLRNVRFT